jgi:subtilase family serine protease
VPREFIVPSAALRRATAVWAVAVVFAVSLADTALLSFEPADAAIAAAPSHGYRHLCTPHTHAAGQMTCDALVRTTGPVQPAVLGPGTVPLGYGPVDLRSAYGLADTASPAATIAIIDAYDDPAAESDLAVYRSQYGLAPCSAESGCFRKVDQTGGAQYPLDDPGWSGEISLDLDMVSAICPSCHILLVEADTDYLSDLGAAVNEAVAAGAKYVSNSYGGPEDPTDAAADAAYFDHPGVAITASAGDGGYGAEYPATSRYVTAVGGTSLSRASNPRGWTEVVWESGSTEGTGSGCSAYISKPAWQVDRDCPSRMEADVSAVADPDTGVAAYDSFDSSGWSVYGGTSAASPIIAAVYALAGPPRAGDYPAEYPYLHTGALWNVIDGSNGWCAPAYFCTAGIGYNGPTGWGTPHGAGAFES